MKIKYQSPILISCLLAITFFSNCVRNKEFEGYALPDSLNGGYSFPIIKSSITLGSAIGSQTSGTGLIHASDSSYYFSYKDSLETDNAETMIKFDPVSVSQKVAIPGFPISDTLPKNTLITYNYDLQFDNVNFASDVTLLYLLLKDGTIGMDVNTTFNQKLSYKITLNSIVNTKQNNKPLEIQGSINYPDNSSTSNVNLKDYKIVMNEAGVPSTSVKAKVELTITPSDQKTSTSPQDVNFTFSITNLKFKRLVGQIKNLTFPAATQNTELNVFNNDIINKIKFADPSVKFTFENSLGVPIKVDLGQIEAVKGATSVKLNYNSTDSLPIFPLAFPDTTKFGQSVSSSVTINKANCPNLIDFLYSAPDHLKYSIGGTIGGNTGYHFITDSSKVKVKYELKVPIYGQINKMSISKTTGYKFPENMFLDSIDLFTDIENHVPLNVKVQIYFTDSDTNNILDSMYVSKIPNDKLNIFEAATNIDNNGRALNPTTKRTIISRNHEWWSRVGTNTRFIIVVGTFYTPEGKDVKFFSDEAVKAIISWSGKGGYVIKK